MIESTSGERQTSAEIDARPMMVPPRSPSRIVQLLKRMFGTWYDILITIVCLSLLVWLVPKIANWVVINAVWFAEDGDKCGPAAGACWAVIDARWRLIFLAFIHSSSIGAPVLPAQSSYWSRLCRACQPFGGHSVWRHYGYSDLSRSTS